MVNKNSDIFESIYGSVFNKAFILGLMKVNPRERKVFFDYNFTQITDFPDLTPDVWINLDDSGLIEFLTGDGGLFEEVQAVFRGENNLDITPFKMTTKKGRKLEGKMIVVERYEDNVPKEFVTVFVDASYMEDTVKEYNKLSAIFESAQSISRASTWWINYDEGTDYFYQTDNGAIAAGLTPTPDQKYSIRDYGIMRERAAETNDDFKEAVEEEVRSFTAASNGETDEFGARTPLLTPNGDLVWTESKGRVILRYDDGSPRFIVAVDIFINDIIDKENELFKFQSLIDQGLTNSNIGVWWHELSEEGYVFHQTKSYKEVMGIADLKNTDLQSKFWTKYTRDFRKKYPEYNSHLDQDAKTFADALSGKIDSYNSVIPVMAFDETIRWVEVRATVIKRDDDNKSTLMVGVNVDITDRLKNEELVEDLQRKNVVLNKASSNAVDAAGLLVWSNDRKDDKYQDILYVNEVAVDVLGVTLDSEGLASMKDYNDSMYPDVEGREGFELLGSKFDLLATDKISSFSNILVKHRNLKTGEPVYLEHYGFIQGYDDDGNVSLVGGYIRNLTEQTIIERKNIELNKLNQRLSRADNLAIKSGKVMVWYQDNDDFDGNDYFFGNDIFATKLGINRLSNGLMSLSDYHKTIYRLSDEGEEYAREFRTILDDVQNEEIEGYNKILVVHKNLITNEIMYIEHSSEVESRYADGYVRSIGGYMVDVTDEIEKQRQIEYLANRDILTTLYNRNYFERFVREELDSSYTLLLFDLDGLKLINDTFGHLEGDKVIVYAADLLKEQFMEDSVIARIGGDEYAVISNVLRETEIQGRYDRINERIANSNRKASFNIALSWGYETVINDNKKFEEAFSFAENLMYRRKLNSRRDRKSSALESIIETLNRKTGGMEDVNMISDTAAKTLIQMGRVRVMDIENIRRLAQVHDIGKITISDEILQKKGKLTDSEYQIIKGHSEAGYKIIHNVIESEDIADGVLYHHERVDGKGYPIGIKGSEIPLNAKILAVADAYEAMIVGRPYAKAKSRKQAVAELIKCSGTQFDEGVVKAFIKATE